MPDAFRPTIGRRNSPASSRNRLSPDVQQLLRCPKCRSELSFASDQVRCAGSVCGARYALRNDIPVLMDEAPSLCLPAAAAAPGREHGALRDWARRLLHGKRWQPQLGRNLRAPRNLQLFAKRLQEETPRPTVLVIGGRTLGVGMEVLLSAPQVELIETDVADGPRTQLICDAHSLPFATESVDGIVVQAVLDDLLEPWESVAEIHRVLKPRGLVYAETAFMQQTPAGACEFTRFTPLGHRWLFRRFEELSGGAVCGPGMALAWSYQYFLLSFVRSPLAGACVRLFARCTGFWLKYFDYLLINRPGAACAASALYFLGRKSDRELSAGELVERYTAGARPLRA